MMYWTVHLKEAPNKDRHQAAVVVGNKLYSFGMDREPQIHVFVFNPVSLCWRELRRFPTGRVGLYEDPSLHMNRGHTAVLIEERIYIWGGLSYCNMLYVFNVKTHRWSTPRVSGTFPKRRFGHSACVLGKVMYIYGGDTQAGHPNNIYKLDTTTMVWSLIDTWFMSAQPTGPATIIGTKMIVFGGCPRGCIYNSFGGCVHNCYNNIGVFDTETDCWLRAPSASSAQLGPEGRYGHSAFAYKGDLYIFAGLSLDNQNCMNERTIVNRNFYDLWQLNPQTFTWKKIEPKGQGPCSGMYRMCCCMMGDRIIIFGGNGNSKDLYILDLSPSLKTLCKLAVFQYGLEQWGLPHNIRWELAAMPKAKETNSEVNNKSAKNNLIQ